MTHRVKSYLIHKIVFIAAVLAPDAREMIVWATWFAITGWLKFYAMLARDRFHYVRIKTCGSFTQISGINHSFPEHFYCSRETFDIGCVFAKQ